MTKILIIEDETPICETLEMFLVMVGSGRQEGEEERRVVLSVWC
jgi:hypothetical protein